MEIIQLRNNGGLDKGGAFGHGEKWLDTWPILEVDPPGQHGEDREERTLL